MNHPGQSGRTLGTGAARVNRDDCFDIICFSAINQAYSRLFFLQSMIPAYGHLAPELSLAIDRALVALEGEE
jgi:hypothetical protein